MISLNTSGNHNVTVPWANGTASSLSESFRKDIKKEMVGLCFSYF